MATGLTDLAPVSRASIVTVHYELHASFGYSILLLYTRTMKVQGTISLLIWATLRLVMAASFRCEVSRRLLPKLHLLGRGGFGNHSARLTLCQCYT